MNVEIRPSRTAAETALAQAYAAARPQLPGVAARRDAAFGRFAASGLPNRRVEAWKYTDLRALMREARPLAVAPDAAATARARTAGAHLAALGARRLVVVDGHFDLALSDLDALEAGLSIGSLARALADGERNVLARVGAQTGADGDPAYALNTAFMRDGVVITLADGAIVERPIHLAFVHAASSPRAVFARSLITIGAGAKVMIVESHEGAPASDYQVNNATDFAVGARAEVAHLKLTGEAANALHVATQVATIGAQARYSSFTFNVGGALVRNQMFVRCAGEGSTVDLGGVSLLRQRQHADNTLVLDHAFGGCVSREMFKVVLADSSRGVFQGKIIVRPHAQKTDARMMSQALLLSPDAEADNKPELEIFADDVQCGHGATAGAIDADLKFYLMARGIPEAQAEALLIQAFAGEAVETIAHAGLREIVMDAVIAWLKAR